MVCIIFILFGFVNFFLFLFCFVLAVAWLVRVCVICCFFSHTTQLIDDIVIAARPGRDSIGAAAESIQLEGVLMVHFGPSNVRIMYNNN